MDSIYNQNIINLGNAYKRALEAIKNLYKLNYFDNKNYEKNISNLKYVLVSDEDAKLFGLNEFAKYNIGYNKIFVWDDALKYNLINEDIMCLLLVHELVHAASSNRRKSRIGFNHDAFPITYNEGCTQYIALKILYGDDFEKALESNYIYPESVRIVKSAVDSLGEEKIFNGFFSADARKEVDGFSPKELDNWVDYIMALSMSMEEKVSKDNQNALLNSVEEYSM